MSKPRIAFLGLGLMGAPMARNLAAAGYALTAWNRTPAKTDALVDECGCNGAETVGQAVASADIVISMVLDGAVLASLIDQAATHLAPGTLWIDMSSTAMDQATHASARLLNHGSAFLDAPVSGGTVGAAAGTLAIMVGGTHTDFDRAMPVFSVLGRATRVGPVGSGQMCKLANQAIVGITVAAVAEAQLFLERGGVDTDAMRDALRGGFADSTILQLHGQRMARRDFTPGGTCGVQQKDMRNVLAQAKALNVTLPLVTAVEQRFTNYINILNGGDKDQAGLFEELLHLQPKSQPNPHPQSSLPSNLPTTPKTEPST